MLFEQLSGSNNYQRFYGDLEKRKGAAEEKSTLALEKKMIIAMKTKQKRDEMDEGEEHKRLKEKLISVKRKYFWWHLFNIEKDLEEAKQELNDQDTSFVLCPHSDCSAVKSSSRRRCFMDAFKHISGNIDKIYKQLTHSSTTGGTAYLILGNVHEPYLHGIQYTAIPPAKRFRDMEQLSGAEKIVAALALLFSIHSYKPSTCFILDEVDAALDNLNAAKVADFIELKSWEGERASQYSLKGKGFQSIVISRKGSSYGKAQALVGVYTDLGNRSSRILTTKAI